MPPSPTPTTRRPVGGLLLTHARPDRVTPWARRGLVSVHITPLGQWCAVTPVNDRARAAAPYDDARMALAARPLHTSLRPSIGFFVTGRRGVVVVQPRGWRTVPRWVVWLPDGGPVRAPGLRPAEAEDLVEFTGAGRAALSQVVEALAATPVDALTWLAGVHEALRLPGRDLLVEADAAYGSLVEPDGESVARFDALMRDEAAHLAEVAHPSRRRGGS